MISYHFSKPLSATLLIAVLGVSVPTLAQTPPVPPTTPDLPTGPVRLTMILNIRFPPGNDNGADQWDAYMASNSKILAGIADGECQALKDIFKGNCRLTGVSMNAHLGTPALPAPMFGPMQTPQLPDTATAGVTASYEITPATTPDKTPTVAEPARPRTSTSSH